MDNRWNRAAALVSALVLAAGLAACASAPSTPTPSPSPVVTPSPVPVTTLPPTPTPSATPVPGVQVTVDFTKLDACAKAYLGEEGVWDYQNMVNAILKREGSYTLKNSSEDINGFIMDSIFRSQCLLRALVPQTSVSDNGKTLYFTYRYDQAMHVQEIMAFEQSFQAIIADIIKPGYNELDSALEIYRYFATRFSYDYSFDPSLGIDIEVYDALKDDLAVCHTFANACRFALQQLGIESAEGRGISTLDESFHAWLQVKLDGQWYHLDPTFENGDTQGT
nr:transglutaminase-like domain-containing protein [bacterium]